MALLQCNFWSDVLRKYCDMTVLLPQRAPLHPEKRRGRPSDGRRTYPVLYLFHGLGGDHRAWIRNTGLESLAQNSNMAIVMPDGGRGFFTDMAHGSRYGAFFSDELPEIAASMFPLSYRREECFLAGASMGGYGALRLALSVPERFGAAFAMSPLTDVGSAMANGNSAIGVREMSDVFGSAAELKSSGNDLYELARLSRESAIQPRLGIFCGHDDFLYQDSVKFVDALRKLAWPELVCDLNGEGRHCWSYWNGCLPELFKFFRG